MSAPALSSASTVLHFPAREASISAVVPTSSARLTGAPRASSRFTAPPSPRAEAARRSAASSLLLGPALRINVRTANAMIIAHAGIVQHLSDLHFSADIRPFGRVAC